MHEHLSSLQLPPSPRPQGLGLELDIEMVTVGGAIEDSSRTQVRRRRTPLPRTQFIVLLLLHLPEPISATVIYPFIAQLVQEVIGKGVAITNVGYYAGLIESLFFVTEATFVLQWGRLSDRIGRKPVLVSGLLGLTISLTSFGLSHTLAGIMISRALAGVLNGNIGVLKSAMGEITDDTNRARAFSFNPLMWFIGVTFAPVIGGYLSHPAERFPSIFANHFWTANPYFLPCGVAALICFSFAIVAALFLEETHPHLRKRKRFSLFRRFTSEISLDGMDPEERAGLLSPLIPEKEELVPEPTPVWSLLTHRVLVSVVNYGLLALLEISLMSLLPIFLATTLHMKPSSIGLFLGLMGLVNGVVQILLFGTLHDRLGSRNVFTLGVCSFLGLFAVFPVLQRVYSENDGRLGVSGILLLGVIVALCPLENMSFNVIFLYVQGASPSASALGATNGIAQTCASIARAIGPAGATSLFALSVQRPDIANGMLVYIVLLLFTFVAIAGSRALPDEPWSMQVDAARDRKHGGPLNGH